MSNHYYKRDYFNYYSIAGMGLFRLFFRRGTQVRLTRMLIVGVYQLAFDHDTGDRQTRNNIG